MLTSSPQVESLTLRADRQTSHRRVPAVPQLKCVSSRGICSKYQIDVLRCENKGSGYDSEDVQWSCTASLPPELKLGSTDVVRVKNPSPRSLVSKGDPCETDRRGPSDMRGLFLPGRPVCPEGQLRRGVPLGPDARGRGEVARPGRRRRRIRQRRRGRPGGLAFLGHLLLCPGVYRLQCLYQRPRP